MPSYLFQLGGLLSYNNHQLVILIKQTVLELIVLTDRCSFSSDVSGTDMTVTHVFIWAHKWVGCCHTTLRQMWLKFKQLTLCWISSLFLGQSEHTEWHRWRISTNKLLIFLPPSYNTNTLPVLNCNNMIVNLDSWKQLSKWSYLNILKGLTHGWINLLQGPRARFTIGVLLHRSGSCFKAVAYFCRAGNPPLTSTMWFHLHEWKNTRSFM